jgi:3-phenylpropionate/cinnamic acid dioxygenase small subunit
MTALSLESRLAIHELIARYSHWLDNYRGVDWSELFTEDGSLVGMEPPLVGREAFVRQSDKLRAGPTEYRHIISNVYILPDATDEQAVARAYGTVVDWAASPVAVSIFVEYQFELVKRGDGWKIARMSIDRPYET